ncbi:MAG: CBS domain-containing protein [Lentisphaerota bacterium]
MDISKNINQPIQGYFLSEIIGAPVFLADKKIGKLIDFVIIDKDKIAEVTHICVGRPFGEPTLFIPWGKVKSLAKKLTVIDIKTVSEYATKLAEDTIFLKDYIVDKKVLDVEDREIEMVYDVKMEIEHGKLYVVGVDLSRYGLLRRMGLKWLADLIYSLAEKIRDQIVGWDYVEPLPKKLDSFKGNIKLKGFKNELTGMQPVDLAKIIEEIDHDQRVVIFDELDASSASETLEELHPRVQRDLIADMDKNKTARLLDEMTPGQAADILSILPLMEMEIILNLVDKKNAAKIRSILDKQEQTILNFAVSNYLKFPPGITVSEACKAFPSEGKGKEAIMYQYILDDQNKLLGVIDIKELLMADDEAKLGDIMTAKVVSLSPDSKLKEASELFARYNFRALPITDDNDLMLGVIPYRDVANLRQFSIE